MNINDLKQFYCIVPTTLKVSQHPILLKTKAFLFGNEKIRKDFLENNKELTEIKYKTELLSAIENKEITLLITGRLE